MEEGTFQRCVAAKAPSSSSVRRDAIPGGGSREVLVVFGLAFLNGISVRFSLLDGVGNAPRVSRLWIR